MTSAETKMRIGMALAVLLSTACSATPGPSSGPVNAGAAGNGSGSSVINSTSASGAGSLSLVIAPGAGESEDSGTMKCAPTPFGRVRDFRSDDGGHYGHPDFEKQSLFTKMDYDKLLGYPEKGIVSPQLGPDQKPVFSGGTFKTVTSGMSFDQWYRDVPNVNSPIDYTLPLTIDPQTSTLVFDTASFFPIDGQGFGNSGLDDNMFVFINGALVIDLGGVHAPMDGSVTLDTLGLSKGSEYPIDIFQAERHTTQSNFRVETTLAFSNCAPIIIPK